MPLKLVGVYSKNCLEYLTLDVACCFYGLTIVPIYDTLGEEATKFAFEQTGMEVCFMTTSHLSGILKLRSQSGFEKLKTIVVMDSAELTEQQLSAYKDSGIRLVKYEEVLESGRGNKLPWV